MKHKIVLLLLFILSAGMYVLTLKGVPGNPSIDQVKGNLDQSTRPLELSPERGRYLLTKSLAEYGSFALPEEYAFAAYPDVGYNDGRYYVYFAPGMSVFALPFYYLGNIFGYAQVGAFSVVTIFALLNLVILYKIGRDIFKFSVPYALIPSFVFGFASTAWAYSVTLYQHHASTFFILSGVYAVWRYNLRDKFSWAWALYVWFIYGLALFVDYPNGLLLLPVMIYFFFSSVTVSYIKNTLTIIPRWVFLSTSSIFVFLMLVHGYYNLINYGGWTRLAGSLVGYKDVLEEQLTVDDPARQNDLKRLEQEKDPIGFFSEYNFPFGLYTLTFSADRGIFVYYPIYLLALSGIYFALRQKQTIHPVLLSLVAINVFLYASFGDPWGGWAFGSRYLIPTMAILSLYIAFWLLQVKQFGLTARVITFTLFMYSLGVSLAGALTTNAVPPKIEADYLKMKHNFLLNFDYLISNRSSSVVYNNVLSESISLPMYYLFMLTVIAVLFMIVLVWSRRYSYEN